MFGENSRLRRVIEELAAEVVRLREIVKEYKDRDAQMRRITEQALELAHEKQFPQEAPAAPDPEGVIRSRATYLAPIAKNCPRCSVSVRADSWPQECPACHTLFGEDWPDVIGEDQDGI